MNIAANDNRADRESRLAWNDIEALPVYAAALMGMCFLWLIVSELSSTLQVSVLKAVGVVGCLALRHAWLSLDSDIDSSGIL